MLKLIDTHDVFTDRHLLHLKQDVRPVWFSTTAKEEKKGLSRADALIAIQDKEAKFFKKLVEDIRVISIGHITTVVSPSPANEQSNNILIIASYNDSNLHATNTFLTMIFPEIRKKVPDSKIILAGKLCTKIEDQDGLLKMGEVEDLGNVYKLADVVVNPVIFGTGLKIKTIEALGYSKPLVTTPVGAEGLEDGINSAYLVAETSEEFAEKVINVLKNRELARNLSVEAYEFARNWNRKCMHQLESLFE